MYQKLRAALGGMCAIPQWFVWRLTWNAAENKYDKVPARSDGLQFPIDASSPDNWLSFDNACTLQAKLSVTGMHALGFYLTTECGYWFLDIDRCVADGALAKIAQELYAMFIGAAGEWSSSARGMHIFGRGTVPAHRTRPRAELAKPLLPTSLEFYTSGRGIAFGLTGEAWGSADTEHSAAVEQLVDTWFAPDPSPEYAVGGDGPRNDWAGPSDDDELLRRAMRATSAAATFAGKPSFRDLFTNNASVLDAYYGPGGAGGSDTERDAALAAHLAFWTGCDAERMERLMRRSALVRPKWDEHRTYLRKLTIGSACARQRDVYREPAAAVTTITVEVSASVERLLDMITASPDFNHIHNVVIPAVRAAGIASALMPRLVNAINKRLDLWDAKLPVSQLRALLQPPVAAASAEDAPEWCKQHVYLLNGDHFFNIENARAMSRTGFNATYDRSMPMREDGRREEAALWCLQRWNMPTVFDVMYRPGHPAVFEWGGEHYANSFSESRLPETASSYTAIGVAGIERFMSHMWYMCDSRAEVYEMLMCWMAHNVQRPGVKIRHAPIIKGVEGDGKSVILNVMRAVLGFRNVTSVGPETVCNSGGFTDWGHGAAVIGFEELMLTGSDRYRVANTIKPFITNDILTINPKGRPGYQVINHANQIAFTNFNDAIPINMGNERRWLVIFTPYTSLDDMAAQLGFTTQGMLKDHFTIIFNAVRDRPGEFRKWLLEYPIPADYDPNANAIDTEEKERMANSGVDDAELITRDIVTTGGYGIGRTVVSSGEISKQLRIRASVDCFDVPLTIRLNHILTRLGFSQFGVVRWDGRAHRCWVRGVRKVTRDKVRELLDETRTEPRDRVLTQILTRF